MAVRYRHHRVCLVRSTTDPGDLDLPDDLDLSDPEAVETEGELAGEDLGTRRGPRGRYRGQPGPRRPDCAA